MNLKIAIPLVEGRLPGHFGEAAHFALVEVDPQIPAIVRTQMLEAPPHEPGSFPRWLRALGVQVLVISSNGIGQRALDNLVYHGIQVCTGRLGAMPEVLAAGYLRGQLRPTRQGCDHQRGPAGPAHRCRLRLELPGG